MSRGLGKIQREILSALTQRKDNEDSIYGLCNSIFKISDAWGDLIPPRTNRNGKVT